jgi:hypothetical protein
MSIGEIANMYKDEEIDIHPEFQRIYRWTPEGGGCPFDS